MLSGDINKLYRILDRLVSRNKNSALQSILSVNLSMFRILGNSEVKLCIYILKCTSSIFAKLCVRNSLTNIVSLTRSSSRLVHILGFSLSQKEFYFFGKHLSSKIFHLYSLNWCVCNKNDNNLNNANNYVYNFKYFLCLLIFFPLV